jgi:hypothetical protein
VKLNARGVNEHGVQMCECKRYGPPHAYEPGEWCTPNGPVIPKSAPPRLLELEEICSERPLSDDELAEVRASTEGADVLPAFEALLADPREES